MSKLSSRRLTHADWPAAVSNQTDGANGNKLSCDPQSGWRLAQTDLTTNKLTEAQRLLAPFEQPLPSILICVPDLSHRLQITEDRVVGVEEPSDSCFTPSLPVLGATKLKLA